MKKNIFYFFILFFLFPAVVLAQKETVNESVMKKGFGMLKLRGFEIRQINDSITGKISGTDYLKAIPLCTPPPVSVNPVTSLICNPGGTAVTLNAIGALTYTWSPSTGLSATTGASVMANPASTTTYTITGTDAVGCTAITTATVSVANKPIISPSATPATICSGSNSELNANANMPSLTYCSTTYVSGTGSGDYISLVRITGTTLNNTTVGAATPYYTLYPAAGSTTASLAANIVYTMTVRGGIFATCFIRGWIDYNQDGLFTDSESIGISPNVGASTSGTILFTVPLSAINGPTRMRLRSSDFSPGPGTSDFCNATNSGFGETEDYEITITGATAQFNYLWSPATFLSGTTINPTNASAVTNTTAYTVLVTSPNGCTASGAATVTATQITVSNPVTATGTIYTAFSQTFTQTGASGAETFTINTGTLPAGLTLSTGGIVSGLPTQTGSFPVIVMVTDGNGCTGIGITYNLVINCQTINVANPLTVSGIAGQAFSQTFTETGAISGSTFSVNTGILPIGLSLSTTGILSGTSTQTGSFPVIVMVTDGNGCTGIGITYNLVINCQIINVTNPLTVSGIAGQAFSQTFTVTGAIAGSTFSVNTGTLPIGLSLSTAGILSGTPLQTGSFPIIVQVTDGNGCIGTGTTYTLVINSATITVNLKLFLQGYYLMGNLMQPVLSNQAVPSALPTEADTIIVELHHSTTFALVDSKKSVLFTNGTVSATFTQPAGSYYICIMHRNSIQTWSSNSIACSASTAEYDFSMAANKAYGNNQIEVQSGVWAFFTGDINQDMFIDVNDFPDFDLDSFNGVVLEYKATDMNGDGFVDVNDFPVFDLNSFNGVTSILP